MVARAASTRDELADAVAASSRAPPAPVAPGRFARRAAQPIQPAHVQLAAPAAPAPPPPPSPHSLLAADLEGKIKTHRFVARSSHVLENWAAEAVAHKADPDALNRRAGSRSSPVEPFNGEWIPMGVNRGELSRNLVAARFEVGAVFACGEMVDDEGMSDELRALCQAEAVRRGQDFAEWLEASEVHIRIRIANLYEVQQLAKIAFPSSSDADRADRTLLLLSALNTNDGGHPAGSALTRVIKLFKHIFRIDPDPSLPFSPTLSKILSSFDVESLVTVKKPFDRLTLRTKVLKDVDAGDMPTFFRLVSLPAGALQPSLNTLHRDFYEFLLLSDRPVVSVDFEVRQLRELGLECQVRIGCFGMTADGSIYVVVGQGEDRFHKQYKLLKVQRKGAITVESVGEGGCGMIVLAALHASSFGAEPLFLHSTMYLDARVVFSAASASDMLDLNRLDRPIEDYFSRRAGRVVIPIEYEGTTYDVAFHDGGKFLVHVNRALLGLRSVGLAALAATRLSNPLSAHYSHSVIGTDVPAFVPVASVVRAYWRDQHRLEKCAIDVEETTLIWTTLRRLLRHLQRQASGGRVEQGPAKRARVEPDSDEEEERQRVQDLLDDVRFVLGRKDPASTSEAPEGEDEDEDEGVQVMTRACATTREQETRFRKILERVGAAPPVQLETDDESDASTPDGDAASGAQPDTDDGGGNGDEQDSQYDEPDTEPDEPSHDRGDDSAFCDISPL